MGEVEFCCGYLHTHKKAVLYSVELKIFLLLLLWLHMGLWENTPLVWLSI